MSANDDTRVRKQVELWHTHCGFVLSLCCFYLCLTSRKRVSVGTIRFDCTNRRRSSACVAAVELFELASKSRLNLRMPFHSFSALYLTKEGREMQ